MSVRVEGLQEAIDNLNKKIDEAKVATQAGLWEAGLQIMRAAQKRLRASVVTGNLRSSGYVRANSDVIRPDPAKLIDSANEALPSERLPEIGIELGFTAMYALYAHENMEGRAPKFLEDTIKQNEGRIVAIIKKRAKLDA